MHNFSGFATATFRCILIPTKLCEIVIFTILPYLSLRLKVKKIWSGAQKYKKTHWIFEKDLSPKEYFLFFHFLKFSLPNIWFCNPCFVKVMFSFLFLFRKSSRVARSLICIRINKLAFLIKFCRFVDVNRTRNDLRSPSKQNFCQKIWACERNLRIIASLWNPKRFVESSYEIASISKTKRSFWIWHIDRTKHSVEI